MLDAGRAPQQIAGLSVFFDHADETRRYLLPGMPRLVADPTPQLSLVLFRGTDQGGLLQFTATLAPTQEQTAVVESTLAATARRPTLLRPDWRSGRMSVAGWLQEAELAPRLLAMGTPSLVGDPVGIISARLDAAGAALADAALRGNALPTVVIFELDMLGLAGPLNVEAEVDLQAVHDRLSAEGALTTPYGRARLASTWESMARENLIRITVVDESGDVASQRAEAMRRIGEDLLARMFSPFPPAERPPQLDNETIAPLELSFRLTIRREELTTRSVWNFRERRAVAIRHYAAASLIDLLGSSPAAAHISFADLTDVQRTIVVRAEPELRALGLSALEIDVRESGDGPVDHALVLTDAHPEARVEAARHSPIVQYRARTRFDPMTTSAANRQSAWISVPGSLVPVSARRLFPPRAVSVIAGRVEFDWLEDVEVQLTVDGEPARVCRLSSRQPVAELFLPAAGDRPVTVVTRWRGVRDEPSIVEPSRILDDDLLVLDSPFADSMNLLVVPLPLPGVATTAVELRSAHRGFVHEKTVSWDASDQAPRQVGLRRLVGSPREYAYRVQLVHDDGTVEERPWARATASTLVVGATGPVDVRTVDVVLLGGGPVGRGSAAVELTLEAGDARAMALLEGDRDSATLVIVVPTDAPPPVLTAREYRTSGEIHETRWVDPQPLTVIAPLTVVTP